MMRGNNINSSSSSVLSSKHLKDKEDSLQNMLINGQKLEIEPRKRNDEIKSKKDETTPTIIKNKTKEEVAPKKEPCEKKKKVEVVEEPWQNLQSDSSDDQIYNAISTLQVIVKKHKY